MKNELSVYIPKPCHEDWNRMSSAEQGRFCQSCCKQVVDFTSMTDQQVLNYFKKASGNICGRFENDQLKRPLQEIKQEKKKVWWLALLMPLLMLFEKSNAQRKHVPLIGTSVAIKNPSQEIMGKVAFPQVEPDTAGNTIEICSEHTSISNATIDEENNEQIIDTAFVEIDTTYLPATLGEIVAVAGGAIAVHPVNTHIITFDTIPALIRKVFHNEPFKVFPNPATKGEAIKVELKNAGNYTIQILNHQSQLIATEYFETSGNSIFVSINLPSGIASGIYYIRVIDEKKKKQYTDKIIIQ
ncbi:MAG: T9SS type A sorting domain-containing protein [Parafilimonas sp.]